jgi:hypothetical protein
MSQFDWSGGAINTSVKTGTQLGSDLNDWKNAVDTSNSGTGRPSYAGSGMVWLDTTTAASWQYKFYDGTSDISLFTIDSTAQTATISPAIISGATTVTAVPTDYVLISDTSDGGSIKKSLVSTLAGSITPPGSSTDRAITLWSGTLGATLLSSTPIVSSFGALSLSNTTNSSTTSLLNLTVAGTTQDLAIKMVGVGSSPTVTIGLPGASNTFEGYVGATLSGTRLFSFDRTNQSATLDGALTVTGIISSGSGVEVITTAAGKLKFSAVEQAGATEGQTMSWNNSGGVWEPRTPTGSGDMILASAQTNTGAKTFNTATLLLNNVAGTFTGQFTNTNTADRTYTLPDAAGTMLLLNTDYGTPSALVLTNATGYEGTSVISTGETGATKFLREDGDGTSSWQAVTGFGDMVLADVQTVTGAKTFNDTKLFLRNSAGTFNGSFVNTNTADRIYTLPDASASLLYSGGDGGTPSALVGTNITGIPTSAVDSGTFADARIASSNITQHIADIKPTETIMVALGDESTALTASTSVRKTSLRMPYAFTLTDIMATLGTAGTGATVIMDVHMNGTSIMTTDKCDIETGEFTTETATTPPALTTTALTANALIELFVDQVGSTIAGASPTVYLIGNRT